MMDNIFIILSIFMFIYGVWGLLTGRLFTYELKDIEVKHHKLYSRAYGIITILSSFVLASNIYLKKYLEKIGKRYSPLQWVAIFLMLTMFISYGVLKKRFKKRM